MPFDISHNFEGGGLGAAATGATAFNNFAAGATYDNTQVVAGTRSAKLDFLLNGEGFPQGVITIPTGILLKDSRMWVRWYWRIASPWSWDSVDHPGATVKVARPWHIFTSGGSNLGYHSITARLIDNGDPGMLQYSNEVVGIQPNIGFHMPVDQWVCIEMYHLLHDVAGEARVWIDGILRYENLTAKTLNAASDKTNDAMVWHSQWNGKIPQNQTGWIDEIRVVETTVPAARDAAGNAMIGPVDWVNPGTDPWAADLAFAPRLWRELTTTEREALADDMRSALDEVGRWNVGLAWPVLIRLLTARREAAGTLLEKVRWDHLIEIVQDRPSLVFNLASRLQEARL